MRSTANCNLSPVNQSGGRMWSAVLLSGIFLSFAQQLVAQRINAGVSSRVTDAAPSARAGAIARGPGGELAGLSAYSTDQAFSKVASGRMQGYGQKSTLGALGESAAPGGSASFGNGGDFPESDFVATMPRPVYAPPAPSSYGLGLHLSGGSVSGSSAFSAPKTRAAATSMPVTHLKTTESIMNPFTPSIGGGSKFGSLPSTSVGHLR